MWWCRFDIDAELNKADEAATAAPSAAQENKSSKSAVSDTVDTAGIESFAVDICFILFCFKFEQIDHYALLP